MSNANEPAFPVIKTEWPNSNYHKTYSVGGLTKREYFAAMLFQQFLSGAVLPPGFDASEQLSFAAERAIEAADAIIAELEKQP